MSFLSKASSVSVLQNIHSASVCFSTTFAADQYQPHPMSPLTLLRMAASQNIVQKSTAPQIM
jgi:hypothetical protein